MPLSETIAEEMKTAARAKDAARLSTLRLIKSEFMKHEVQGGSAPTEDQCFAILKKMAKQRRDSIEQFRAGARVDLAEKEEVELKVIESFLPAGLSDEQIDAIVDEALGALTPEELAKPGQVIGKVMAKLKATGASFDGKAANERIQRRLKA